MSLALKLLAPLFVVVTLAVGVWFWAGEVAPGYRSAIALGVLWFVVCSVAFGRIGKWRPELRWWLRGPFLACTVAAMFAFYWTSVREREVNETIVTGVAASELRAEDKPAVDPLAPQAAADSSPATSAAPKPKANVVERTGAVRPQSHSASGTARVVRLAAGGRRLTLSDGFEIDPGPQVRVYLATDAAGKTFKDVGPLKGSKGSQQYTIPAGVDLERYDTVVFWCVPFTQSLASAELVAA